MKAERFVSVLLVVTLTGVISGCQKAPEPAATQDRDEPAAPPPELLPGPERTGPIVKEPPAARPAEPPARPAAPDVARDFDQAAGFRLPGTIVAVELRSLASVIDAAARVADTVQPGAGMMLGQVIAGAAGFDGYEAFRSSLSEKPAAFLILNRKVHPGWLACAFGVEDGEVSPELVVKVAKTMGLDFRDEPGGFSVEMRPGQRFFFRLVGMPDGGWAIGALTRETLEVAVEAVRAGAVPRAPAAGDHVAVHVDMVELRSAFGAEIDQGLAQMRTMLGANPLVKQSPAFGRLMQEYAAALGAIVKGFDGLAMSLKISPEAVEITQRVRPAAGSVFEPVALRPRRANWIVADVLPPEAPVAIAMRIDEGALRPLGEALVKGVVRAASGGEPDRAKIDEVLGLFSKVFADGTESAVAVTGYSPLGPMGVGAMSTDFETYRAMQKETAGFLSLFDEIWKALGLRMKFEYQADVGRLGGRPVDRTVTSIEPEAAGPNAAMMAQAFAQFGGQTETVAEFVGTPEGVIYATGKEPRKLLEEAVTRRRESAGFRGTGWASASPALGKLLERAPERTWCAGEVRPGAYFAMALKSVAKNLPIQLPDTAVLTGNDPPLAFWVAAEGGEIVSRGRVPVVSVKNLVSFFTRFGMQFRPPAGDEDFEFKDEDFDDGGEVW